jgi:predicted AlkP superfamily phosphohydrolase/phosphomutase
MDVIVLGVDGVDPDYLDEAIEKRDMPSWERLREESFYSELPSTVPSITVPAWQCMFSGYDAGRFDTYNMNVHNFETMSSEIANSSNFRGDFFWDNMGGKASLHYVPGTSPVYEINGWMRSGFPSPGTDFYPEELGKEIFEHFESDGFGYKDEREIGRLMMDKDAEVFVSVIRMTDVESHHSADISGILDAYERTDEFLGDVLDKAEEEDANLIVASDHGFMHADRKFNVLKLLENGGFLEFTDERETSLLYRLAQPLLKTPLRKPLKKIHERYRSRTGNEINDKQDNILDAIEPGSEVLPSWKPVGREMGLKINTEEMPNGDVSEEGKEDIIEWLEYELTQLEDNEKKVVQDIWRGEELYQESEHRPDVVFRTTEEFVPDTVTSDLEFLNTNSFTHDVNGVFFAQGPDIDQEADEELEIYDVAPLIYALLDEKAPEDMRGELPQELVPDKELHYRELSGRRAEKTEYDEDQEEEVKEKLKDLGYM